MERSGATTSGQCSNGASLTTSLTTGQPGGIWRFQKHPASPGNCLNKPEPKQAFGSHVQGYRAKLNNITRKYSAKFRIEHPLKQQALNFSKKEGWDGGWQDPSRLQRLEREKSRGNACTFTRTWFLKNHSYLSNNNNNNEVQLEKSEYGPHMKCYTESFYIFLGAVICRRTSLFLRDSRWCFKGFN